MNPAVGYNRFDILLARVEAGVRASAPAALGYSKEVVADRLLQRIVELGLHPSMRAAALRHEAGQELSLPSGGGEELGGLRIEGSRVSLTAGAWLRSVGEFFVQWLRAFGVMARALSAPLKSAPPIPATLLFGVGGEDLVAGGSDARFVEFCRKGPLPVLVEAKHVLVERAAPFESADPEFISYVRYPLFEAARLRRPSVRGLGRFVLEQLRAAGAFVRLAVGHGLSAILARDLAFHALVGDINRRGLVQAIVITNSHYHVQPLWMRALPERKFTTHFAWYSQNSIPFMYARDGIRSYLPNHRHIYADHIWVWTPGYAEYLRERGARCNIHVVGPILWYLAPPVPTPRDRLQIVAFDVTPQVPSFALRAGLSYNYYRASNVVQFIADIVQVRDEIERALGQRVAVVLKHKRTPSVHHDPGYVALVRELAQEGRIRLVSPETDVYHLIQASSIAVVIPYSSPAYVSDQLGVPAIYYDPAGELVPSYEATGNIEFAAGRAALKAAMLRLLGDNATLPPQPGEFRATARS